MSRAAVTSEFDHLSAHEGRFPLWAHEALLKGALESELELSLLVAPPKEPFAGLQEAWADERARALLRRHGLQFVSVPRGDRALTLARAAARSGARAMAVIPNADLGHALHGMLAVSRDTLPQDAGLCLLLEDHPEGAGPAPREAAMRLQLPCLEPADAEQLRDAVEQSLWLSQAGRRAVGLVVHNSILRSAEPVALWPNRVVEVVDTVILRQTAAVRKARRAETGGLMRMARLFELNRSACLPSPGERVPVGFIVVGPAYSAICHLTHLFKLTGRVPLLHLRLLHPLDESAVQRILCRCDQVVVLEPRPGVMEGRVLAVAEQLRHRGERSATVWGRTLPPDPSGEEHVMASHLDLHPSILARKIVHLLHSIRPAVQVASQLVPEPPRAEVEMAPRGAGVGFAAARQVLLRLLAELDRWLRSDEAAEERDIPATALAIDGVTPEIDASRLVMVEIWEPARFLNEGIPALRQAARDDQPWIFIIGDFGADDAQDLERLARAAVPAERAERVRITVAGLDDGPALRDTLRTAAREDRMTVIVLRDGSPPRYDIPARERALAEIDRLGYEPRQQMVWPAELSCAFRPPTSDGLEHLAPARDPAVEHRISINELPRRAGSAVRIGLRPLLEMVEVLRTRPPAQTWRRHLGSGLPLPEPIHATQSQWRCHIAGTRGRPPGPAAAALVEAGRAMGYAASCVHDPTPIAAGRRAWAQVLFTHPRPDEAAPALTVRIPFGEADLVLGLEPVETIRALSEDPTLRVAYSDRTCGVVNSGAFAEDHPGGPSKALLEALGPMLQHLCRPGHAVREDVSGACRAWFRNERLTDLALLGIAFQRGYVPLTLDAMESGIRSAEDRGCARLLEAFQFGRRLALDQRPLWRPKTAEEEPLERTVRRATFLLRHVPFGGAARAARFARMVQRSLEAMPGLTETEPGRAARRDFVAAVLRCVTWGGLDYAQRYCDLMSGLYRADRGEHGRILTRNAILPLAEAMLIREPLYVLAMATGPGQYRTTRQRLNVKRARGDQFSRRYLSRLEVVALRRRLRLDMRTSDGVAQFIAWWRRVIPQAWRGTREQRDLRQAMCDLVSTATETAATDFERCAAIMTELHQLAVEDRLRGYTPQRLSRLLDERGPDTQVGATRGLESTGVPA